MQLSKVFHLFETTQAERDTFSSTLKFQSRHYEESVSPIAVSYTWFGSLYAGHLELATLTFKSNTFTRDTSHYLNSKATIDQLIVGHGSHKAGYPMDTVSILRKFADEVRVYLDKEQVRYNKEALAIFFRNYLPQ